jgi:uncharacterized protein (DUF58 family)
MMSKVADWLETHWVTPAYTGWVLIGIGLSYFAAATNTMAGWLYVLSGMMFAVLALNGFICLRTVNKLKVKRLPIAPVTVGEQLTIEIVIENPTQEVKTLLQIIDQLPFVLSPPITTAVETILPLSNFHWSYYVPTHKRGVYHWHEVQLKTAAPLGVFCCRRSRELPTKAIVYPLVLPLKESPLVDRVGREENVKLQNERFYQAATEGITKALRQYRFGDPTRLIHWRSSARFGELQVRELEVITGGEDVIICLDNSPLWNDDYFEEAVIAAASLYFYARRSQLNVKLWTADTGMIQGARVVLETLAGIEYGKGKTASYLPPVPLIWLAQDSSYLECLVPGSRWLLFPSASGKVPPVSNIPTPGLIFNPEETLESQLQKPLSLIS